MNLLNLENLHYFITQMVDDLDRDATGCRFGEGTGFAALRQRRDPAHDEIHTKNLKRACQLIACRS